eukprot:gene29042-35055_t
MSRPSTPPLKTNAVLEIDPVENEWMEGLLNVAGATSPEALDLRQCSSPLMLHKQSLPHSLMADNIHTISPHDQPSAQTSRTSTPLSYAEMQSLSRSSSFSSYTAAGSAVSAGGDEVARYRFRAGSTDGELSVIMEDQEDGGGGRERSMSCCSANSMHSSGLHGVHLQIQPHLAHTHPRTHPHSHAHSHSHPHLQPHSFAHGHRFSGMSSSHYTPRQHMASSTHSAYPSGYWHAAPHMHPGILPPRVVTTYTNSSEGNTPLTPHSPPSYPQQQLQQQRHVRPQPRKGYTVDSDSEGAEGGEAYAHLLLTTGVASQAADEMVVEDALLPDSLLDYPGHDIYGLGLFGGQGHHSSLQPAPRQPARPTRPTTRRSHNKRGRRGESDGEYEEEGENDGEGFDDDDDDDDNDDDGSQSRGRSRRYRSNDGGGGQLGRKKASETARTILMDWLVAHQEHPYPTRKEKEDLARKTGMGLKQIMHWMSNVRKRRFLPLISGRRKAESTVDLKFLEEFRKRQKSL